MDAQEQASADQISAAERERIAANHDIAHWLQPEGIERQVLITPGTRFVGPVTGAFTAWLNQAPHPAGCELVVAGPRPVFGFLTDPKLYCAACFDTILKAFARTEVERDAPMCMVCRYDVEAVSPTTMQVGVITLYALVCAYCQREERKAAIQERYTRVAGQLPKHMRDADTKPDHR